MTTIENDLGRNITSAERLDIATGKTTIGDILHGVALELDEARRAEVVRVMPSGVILTRGEIEDEMRIIRLHQLRTRTGYNPLRSRY